MSSYVGGQWRRWFDRIANDRRIAVQVQVPMWTPEDLDNLTRRIQRLSKLPGQKA